MKLTTKLKLENKIFKLEVEYFVSDGLFPDYVFTDKFLIVKSLKDGKEVKKPIPFWFPLSDDCIINMADDNENENLKELYKLD